MSIRRTRSIRFALLLCPVLILLLASCGSTTGSAPASPQGTGTPPATSSPAAPTATGTVPVRPGPPLHAIRMLDGRSGWALSASSILTTSDGGLHWRDVTPASAGLTPSALGQFLDTQHAWIAIGPANEQEGPGIVILRTNDGGASWQRSTIPDALVSRADMPHFLNPRQGWLEASSTPGAGRHLGDQR